MELTERIKIEALAYWKFARQHQFGAIECWNNDVITVSRSLMITDTEIKTSISDMQRELKTKQFKHRRFIQSSLTFGLMPKTHYFYFAVPENLLEKARIVCQERYPYAGLLVFKRESASIYSPEMECAKRAKRFNRPKATLDEVRRIAYIASNNIIKYSGRDIKEGEE